MQSNSGRYNQVENEDWLLLAGQSMPILVNILPSSCG